jgi:eukaryotic-like serine/threonine-protein kinase
MDSRLDSGDPRRVGRYQLIGRLGEGGMGTVYLATDPRGRQVALKLVRSDLALDEQFRGRFRSEVNRARQVPPFCTAEVLDADPLHDPPYLVVEYIEGPNLYQVVQRQGPLSRANLHSVAVGIATALSAIHGAGVIHRDLKPGNVLFGLGGIKVIDFGIARALDPTSHHTRTNQMVGTIAYMAPERFDHETASRVGTAADIFAWGAVVAFAGTGRTPFGADSGPTTAVRILTQPPELFDLEEPMRSLVEHTLAKDPRDRPTSRELLDRLLETASQAHVADHAAEQAQPAPRINDRGAGRAQPPRVNARDAEQAQSPAARLDGRRTEQEQPAAARLDDRGTERPHAWSQLLAPSNSQVSAPQRPPPAQDRRPVPSNQAVQSNQAAPGDQAVQSNQAVPAGKLPPANLRGTPFLREIVESAAANKRPPAPRPAPLPTPVPIPMTARPWGRQRRPSWLGALRRVQVVAAGAVVLAVSAAVVIALNAGVAPPDASAGQSPATAAPLSAPSTEPPSVLSGQRRIALRLTGTEQELGLENDGRVSMRDSADPTDFVLSPFGGSYLIRPVAQRTGVSQRCLVVKATGRARWLALGSCSNPAISYFTFAAVGDGVYVISSAQDGAVQWSYDRAAIFLEFPGGDSEATTFTLIDRGPI